MKCHQCGKTNDEQARFCESCGASLQNPVCPKCGKENDADSKFCVSCGGALGVGKTPPKAERERPASAGAARRRMPGWAWALIGILALGLIAGAVLLINPALLPDNFSNAPAATSNPESVALGASSTDAPIPTRLQEPTAAADPALVILLQTALKLSNPRVESLETFQNWTGADWGFSDNVSVAGGYSGLALKLPGTQPFATYLNSPPIDPGSGMLAKFMLSGTSVEFFLTHGGWQTSGYRRFGGAIYNGGRMETTIWRGTDNSLANEKMDGYLVFSTGQWYGMFIGVDQNSNFRFVAWNWDDPDQFVWHDFAAGSGWEEEHWQFDVHVDEGTVLLDDYHVISFSGMQGISAIPTRTAASGSSGSGGGAADTPVPPPDQGGGDTGGQPACPPEGTMMVNPFSVPFAGNYTISLSGLTPGISVEVYFTKYPSGETLFAPQSLTLDGAGSGSLGPYSNAQGPEKVYTAAVYNGCTLASAVYDLLGP